LHTQKVGISYADTTNAGATRSGARIASGRHFGNELRRFETLVDRRIGMIQIININIVKEKSSSMNND